MSFKQYLDEAVKVGDKIKYQGVIWLVQDIKYDSRLEYYAQTFMVDPRKHKDGTDSMWVPAKYAEKVK